MWCSNLMVTLSFLSMMAKANIIDEDRLNPQHNQWLECNYADRNISITANFWRPNGAQELSQFVKADVRVFKPKDLFPSLASAYSSRNELYLLGWLYNPHHIIFDWVRESVYANMELYINRKVGNRIYHSPYYLEHQIHVRNEDVDLYSFEIDTQLAVSSFPIKEPGFYCVHIDAGEQQITINNNMYFRTNKKTMLWDELRVQVGFQYNYEGDFPLYRELFWNFVILPYAVILLIMGALFGILAVSATFSNNDSRTIKAIKEQLLQKSKGYMLFFAIVSIGTLITATPVVKAFPLSEKILKTIFYQTMQFLALFVLEQNDVFNLDPFQQYTPFADEIPLKHFWSTLLICWNCTKYILLFIHEEIVLKTSKFNGDSRLENVLTHLGNAIFYDMRPPLLTKLISMQEDQRMPGLRLAMTGFVGLIVVGFTVECPFLCWKGLRLWVQQGGIGRSSLSLGEAYLLTVLLKYTVLMFAAFFIYPIFSPGECAWQESYWFNIDSLNYLFMDLPTGENYLDLYHTEGMYFLYISMFQYWGIGGLILVFVIIDFVCGLALISTRTRPCKVPCSAHMKKLSVL